ncbi:MAG TPA: hypothetical protein VMH89_04120 [Candidatus Acidoferrum sp.]|nr:hypothetical protein [Candidatus Acidoferrum sp.]
MSIRVILADHSKVMQREFRDLLRQYPEIELVAVANDFAQMIQLVEDLKPDVIVLEPRMRDAAAFTPEHVKTRLNGCASRILVVSLWSDPDSLSLANRFGAFTLLRKVNLYDELIPTIMQVALTVEQRDEGVLLRHKSNPDH